MGAEDAAGNGQAPALAAFARELRQASGLTQRQLAGAAGVSLGAVRDLEQGTSSRPRSATLARLAATLGVSAAEFQTFRGPPAAKGCGGAGPVTRFQVFGALRAWRNAAEVPVAGASRRAVLGLLLLRPGRVLSRGEIADILWDGEPPASAAAVIQSHISRLRSVLHPRPSPGGGRLIETAGDGYRLRPDGIEIDLVGGQEHAARARAAFAAGNIADAFGLFDQALACWQGQPLADVPLVRRCPAVLALEQDRDRLVVEYAEAASERGWHDRVLPHLDALAGRDPLNERAHACLMIALAGSGQQAAALAVFERMRRRLDDQLGVRPGAILAGAHTRVLRHDITAAVTGCPAK